jgi:hypothetical protein
MKHILITLITFCLFSCSGNKKNSLTDLNLKGDVRILSEFGYKAIIKFGEIQKDSLQYRLISDFDKNGNLVSENWLDIGIRNIYIYDSIGNLIEDNLYDEKKSISGFTSKKKLIYDEKSNLIEKNTYLPSGFLIEKIVYDYDVNKNNIESKCYKYDFEGKELLQFTDKYKYDKKGNQIERIHYDKFGDNYYTEKYEYDENRLMIEEFSDFLKEFQPPKKTYIYDENKNILKIKHYSSKNVFVKEETYKYKLDSYGNWILKTHYINGKPDLIEERKITYEN